MHARLDSTTKPATRSRTGARRLATASLLLITCAWSEGAAAGPPDTVFRLLPEGLGTASRATAVKVHDKVVVDFFIIGGQVRHAGVWRAAVWPSARTGSDPVGAPIVLEDTGFGGGVNAVDCADFDEDGDVDGDDFLVWNSVAAGYVHQDASGRRLPALWTDAGNLFVLPTLAGGEGEATSVYVPEPNGGGVVAVGSSSDAGGREHAVAWFQTPNGFTLVEFVREVVPDGFSRANDVTAAPNGDLLVGGWSAGDFTGDGVTMHATLWPLTPGNVVPPVPLTSAAIPWSELEQVEAFPLGIPGIVAAGALGAGPSAPRPILWGGAGHDFRMTVLPTPNAYPFGRVRSIAEVQSAREAFLLVAGEVLDAAGSSRAYGWKVEEGTKIRPIDLGALAGDTGGAVLLRADAVDSGELGASVYIVGEASTQAPGPHAYLIGDANLDW